MRRSVGALQVDGQMTENFAAFLSDGESNH